VIERLRRWLLAGFECRPYAESRAWLVLALLCAGTVSLRGIHDGFFTGPFVVANDARQFVFWMQRFVDPELFRHDLIADYFEGVTPVGYAALLRTAAWLGIAPIAASKLLVVPITLAFAYYTFRFTHALVPKPALAFLAAWACLAADWWFNDSLANGLPRSFSSPLLIAFLFYLVVRSRLGVCISIGALALFYPQMAVVAAGILCLNALDASRRGPVLVRERLGTVAAGLAVFLIAVIPFAHRSAVYGPTTTLAQARVEPTFQRGVHPVAGRTVAFEAGDDVWDRYVIGGRLAYLSGDWRLPVVHGRWPALDRAWEAGLLGLVLGLPVYFWRRRSTGIPGAPAAAVRVFADALAAATILYAVSSLVAFRLHVPNRYSTSTFSLVVPIAVIVAAAPALAAITRRMLSRKGFPGPLLSTLVFAVGIPLAVLGVALGSARGLVHGRATGLYHYLEATPKHARVASLHREADNIPIFARRSVVVARKYAIPYNRGYFLETKARLETVARAIHGLDAAAVRMLIDDYATDLVVVHESEIGAADRDWWAGVIPGVAAELANASTPETSRAFARLRDACAVSRPDGFSVLDARCMLAFVER